MAHNALPINKTSGFRRLTGGGLPTGQSRPVVRSQLSVSSRTTVMSHLEGQPVVVTPIAKAAVAVDAATAAFDDETAGGGCATSVVSSVVGATGHGGDDSSLAGFWREVHGAHDWEYLVQPLHPLLRDEIVRYGEFVTACYKAFDLDPSSKRYLNCKYGKQSVLREVGMGSSGYEVTKYIYATPDIAVPIQNGDSCGRWVGYVAVSSDEAVRELGRRDVVITFRGTVTHPEWIANLMSSLTPARLDPHHDRPDVKVESGFLSLYTSEESTSRFGLGSCREQLLSEVSRLVNKYKGEELSITLAGHSMGSSLAVLLAYDITELGLNGASPVTVFSFGGPRVGNAGFKKRCEELGVKILRVVNVNDPITKLPGVLFNENLRVFGGMYDLLPWRCSCYAHVGVEVVLDFFNVKDPSCVHDLETYISLLRCPNKDKIVDRIHKIDGRDFLITKARELLFSAQNFNVFPFFQNAGLDMVSNFVQSQRS